MELEDGEVKEDVGAAKDAKEEDPLAEASAAASGERNEQKTSYSQSNGGGFRRDGNSRMRKTVSSKFGVLLVVSVVWANFSDCILGNFLGY